MTATRRQAACGRRGRLDPQGTLARATARAACAELPDADEPSEPLMGRLACDRGAAAARLPDLLALAQRRARPQARCRPASSRCRWRAV